MTNKNITKEELKSLVDDCRNSMSDIARELDISRAWLYVLLVRYDLRRECQR